MYEDMISALYGPRKSKNFTFLRYITIFGYSIEPNWESIDFKKSSWSHVCVHRICSKHHTTTPFASDDRYDHLQALKYLYHVTWSRRKNFRSDWSRLVYLVKHYFFENLYQLIQCRHRKYFKKVVFYQVTERLQSLPKLFLRLHVTWYEYLRACK